MEAGFPLAPLFFIPVVIIISFLIINLFVAVVCAQFAWVREKYDASPFKQSSFGEYAARVVACVRRSIGRLFDRLVLRGDVTPCLV